MSEEKNETKQEAVMQEPEQEKIEQKGGDTKEEVAGGTEKNGQKKGKAGTEKPAEEPAYIRKDGKEDFSSKSMADALKTGKAKKVAKLLLGGSKRAFTRTDY